jgi:hypothetical protein
VTTYAWYLCLMCVRAHMDDGKAGIAGKHRQYAHPDPKMAFGLFIPSDKSLRRQWVRDHHPEIKLAGKAP